MIFKIFFTKWIKSYKLMLIVAIIGLILINNPIVLAQSEVSQHSQEQPGIDNRVMDYQISGTAPDSINYSGPIPGIHGIPNDNGSQKSQGASVSINSILEYQSIGDAPDSIGYSGPIPGITIIYNGHQAQNSQGLYGTIDLRPFYKSSDDAADKIGPNDIIP